LKLALVPSDQSGVEQPLATTIATVTVSCLRRVYAVDARLFLNTAPTNDYVGLTKAVNNWGAEWAVHVHSNADGGSTRVNGIMGLCYSDRTRAWVQHICMRLASSLSMAYEGTRTPAEIGRGSLYALSASTMPSAIVEIGAWDTAAELDMLKSRMPEIGAKLADAIAASLGIKQATPLPQEDPMSIDNVHDAEAVNAAQDRLIKAGLLHDEHPTLDAAGVSLLIILCDRLLTRLQAVEGKTTPGTAVAVDALVREILKAQRTVAMRLGK